MVDLKPIIETLVVANRILAHEGVVDAYGHISVRHPENPAHYLLSRSRSPELVEPSDILEFSLDGHAVAGEGQPLYTERPIHGAIYEARPDVMAVVHNHSYEVIPFSVTQVPLRAIFHVGGRIGSHVPVWDIRDTFGDTNLLVVTMEQGRDLAACLGQNRCILMRGHGCSVADSSIQNAVITAIYLQVNARIQMDALRLGDVTYLSPGEIAARPAPEAEAAKLGRDRVWEYLRRCAGVP
jgi:ribulose-5-phosphate 4-epimerase/fuculose-1-phosphate aldolase